MGKSFLIVTNSADGTSDCLVRLLAQENRMFLRWNIDLWQHYEITVTNHNHSVSDPAGRTIDLADRNTMLLWRKPFVDQMNFDSLPLDLIVSLLTWTIKHARASRCAGGYMRWLQNSRTRGGRVWWNLMLICAYPNFIN